MRLVFSIALTVSVCLAVTAFVSLILAPNQVEAHERNVRCELTINGRAYLRGRCAYQSLNGDGSFQIWELRDPSYFAEVEMIGDGTAQGSWNGDRGYALPDKQLGILTRHGACWVNRRVRVCAQN